MDVRVEVMIQDPLASRRGEMALTEPVVIRSERHFLAGPVSERLAVLDLDAGTGALHPGVPFRPPPRPGGRGSYGPQPAGAAAAPGPEGRAFRAVNVFGTALRTLALFEAPDTLGRRVTWAFNAPQLLLVPHAGQRANAFYERRSHSVQFFSFPSGPDPATTIYTSLSHDIIAHETAHAILDGIAPDLYNAVTPQSLALHEAIADLTALLLSFRVRTLRQAVLAATGGSIENATAFSWIAEEFGYARDPLGRVHYLRSLHNQRTLDPADTSRDELGRPNLVRRHEPHTLCQVLTGALYGVMVRIHDLLKQRYGGPDPAAQAAASGKALYVAAERFKRMILRALDFLPPGEISFGDYGRAIVASDQASFPGLGQERDWIRDEFVRRCMVPNRQALEVETNFDHPAVQATDLAALLASDWAAYEFANQNRALLRIPAGVPFQVRPRLDVTKLYYQGGNDRAFTRELILKVAWEQPDPPGQPARLVTAGTSLVIDWRTKKIRACLTSDQGEEQQADREGLMGHLAGLDLLRLDGQALGPDNRPRVSVIGGRRVDGLLRLEGTGRLLHIVGEE